MPGLTLELEPGMSAIVTVDDSDGSQSTIEITAVRERSGRLVLVVDAPHRFPIRREKKKALNQGN